MFTRERAEPGVKSRRKFIAFSWSENMSGMQKVLVIEDDDTVRDVLRSFLGEKGFEVTLARNGAAGLDMVRAEKFDLILTDLVMPGVTGMDVLREVVAAKISIPVIVMTAFGTVQTAVEAMRIGAF